MSLYDELRAGGAPAQPAPASGSLYDELTRQREEEQRVRAGLTATAKTTPQRAAELNYLSQVTGMPRAAVENAEDEAKARAQFRQIWEESQDSPVLRARLADPKFTELAKDDVRTLANTERTFMGTLGDIGVTALKGAVGLPQGLVGLLNLPSGGEVGLGVESAGIRFKDTQKILDGWYSLAQQEANRAVNEAKGFVDTLVAMGANPSTIATLVGESLPQMLGGMALGRGLVAMAPKLAPWLAAAFGEGLMTAGSVSENMRADSATGTLTGKQMLASVGAGAGTAVFGAAGGKLAAKLGVGDIDTVLVKQGVKPADAAAVRGGFVTAIGKAGISEGVFEELPQSIQEQMWQNWANDRPLGEGVGKAAAQGLVAGMATGGGFQAIAEGAQRLGERLQTEEDQQQRALGEAQRLMNLMTIAGQSQLRERDPEQFRGALSEMSQKAGKELVYIDAQVLNQLPPDVLAQLPGAQEQLEAALVTNSTVELKIADVLTVAPGSGLEQTLVENIRMAPDALSPADVKQAQDQLEVLNQDAERVVQQAADAQMAEAARENVKATILDQLNTAQRFSPEVNNAYATLTGNFYTVLGSRLGISAQDAYARYPLRVVAGQGTQQFELDENSSKVLAELDNDTNVAALEKNAGKLRKLYRAAGKAKPTFDALMTRIAKQVDGGAMLAPLKGTARATAKIRSDYAGDPTKIKDLVRGTIEIRTAAQAQAAVRQILTNFRVLPTGQRNLLTPDADPIDGYRDAKFNVDLGNGVVGEVQINLPQMLAAKKQAHGFYEERSVLERQIQDEKRMPTAGEQARIEALNAAMKSIYDAAWTEAMSALNSDSESGAPLRRAESGSNSLGGNTSQAEQYATAPGTAPSETGTPSTSKNSGISGTSDTSIADAEVFEQQARQLTDDIGAAGGTVVDVMQVDQLIDSKNIPVITLQDMVGLSIFPTIADRTAAAALYTGIDSSRLDVAIPLLGGPFFPLRETNVQANVVWANRGKGVIAQKAAKLKEGANYMLVLMGDANMHQSNSTVAAAFMGTLEAWARDGRISAENVEALGDLVRAAGTNMTGKGAKVAKTREHLENFPGFDDVGISHAYMDGISFDARKRILEIMASKQAQALGAPPMQKILDATREPSLAGHRWGDGVLLVEVDQTKPQVELGAQGTTPHPDFPVGVRGRVVGKLNAPISWELLWQDWLQQNADKDGPRRAFELAKPIVTVTQELVDRIGPIQQANIDGSRQARLAADFAANNWRTSDAPVNKGGVSPQAFVDALMLSDAKDTLTQYTLEQVKKGVKDGTKKIYQLGDGQIFFMLEKRQGGGILLASVVNNEPGARGIGAPAVVLKALEEGATHLDCFAVKNERFPDGFLPSLYGAFGFQVSESYAFDPAYFQPQLPEAQRQLALADAVNYWRASTPGFDPQLGMPDAVVMTWSGTDADRQQLTERYLRSGLAGLLAGGVDADVRASSAQFADPNQAAAAQGAPANGSGIGGDQRVDPGVLIASRARGTVQAVAGLTDSELANLGLTPADRSAVRRALGLDDGEFEQSPIRSRAQRADAADGADGRGANPHSWSGTGIHFSRQRRSTLDGRYFGTGLKGVEQTRLRESTDPRIRERVYFYIDEGSGVRPEAGVGGFAHEVQLENLYNVQGDPLKLFNAGDLNASESRVLDAGYSGYYFPAAANRQGIAIVMGEASRGMQATVVNAPASQPAAPAAPQVYRRGLLSSELNALDIDAVRAVAPSANVRAGNFSVNAEELDAARQVMAGQGINLPEQVLNQTLAEDMDAQVQFLTERAQEAGYPDVDTWLANDVAGFMQAAEEWRQMNPADALTQPARGTFNPSKLLMTLNDNADLSTFLHETGHFFLEVMADVASQPGAPAEIANDMNAVLKWFGVKDLATWNGMSLNQKRKHHERFAEGFEQYLLEGKAPSRELQVLFRKFRNFLTRVYQSIEQFLTGRDIELSDDVRQVFDRLLATDEQIAEAEQYTGLQAQFDATDEATEKLQSRSLRDLKWAVNARNKMIKQLQAQARDLRKAMEAKVRAEVEEQPVYKAMRALREGPKLSTEGLADLYMGEGDKYALLDWKPLTDRKLAGKEGMHPDIAADMFGFPNGDALVRAILEAEPIDSVVEAITTQRMLEEHGDLVDQRAIEEAATEAVHNEARARALATELSAQRDMMGQRADTGRVDSRGRPITVNALLEAAKQFAAQVTGRRKIGELKRAAWSHLQAERRAAKAWEQATAKGDTQAAVKAKQDQLLNHEVYRAMVEAQRQVDKANAFFAKVFKGNNERLVERGYDPDIVAASRAILSAYGLAPRAGKSALEYMDLVAKNDPELAAVLRPSVEAALSNAKPYDQLTFDELEALQAEIESMQNLAKRSRQMEVDGDLLDMDEAEGELKSRMESIGVPLEVPGQSSALTPKQERTRWLQFFKAVNRRIEQWSDSMGPEFTRLVFGPIKSAANRYRADRAKYRRQYQQLLDKVAPQLRKGPIAAPELGYTFGEGHNGIGHAELLHAILHTGNQSNKRKLLLGRGWATENPDGTLDTTRWDAFVERMQAEGYLAKAHYDFVQGVWDLLESTKPLAQKAHRTVFGRYFAEVTAEPFETPFGVYRGGYAPAQADPRIVTDAALRKLVEMENENMAYSFPATNKGFTKSRVDYNRPLMLDLRSIGQHLDKVLLFSHMEPAVRDVNRLLRRKGVMTPLSKIDPAAYEGALIPWLNRAARQQVEAPIVGDGGVSRVLNTFRNRAGMSLMFANLSNTVQQITGFSLAAVKVKPSLLMKATAQYIASPKKTAQFVSEQSIYMKDRMDNEIAAINDAMEDILLDPSAYKKAQNWTQKHAYFLQAAFDNVLSPIVWTGAYNQALEQGASEAEAVKAGDAAVRQTQGSTLPEDVSRIESGPAAARLFTQFLSYFNMMANTNGGELTKIAREVGLKKGAGKALYVVTLGLLLPMWVAEAIAIAFRGGPEDEDEDGWYLDDWIASVMGMGTIKGSLAMVPFVGQFANAGLNRLNDNPADDRVSLSPAVSLIEAAVGAPISVYNAIVEDGSARRAVRDVASAVSIATGLPAIALARPVSYLTGVMNDEIEPTGPVDFARGLVTGAVSPESRQ